MDLRHITLEGFASDISYKGTGRGNFTRFSRSDAERKAHGRALLRRVDGYLPDREDLGDYISAEEPGVYLEVSSLPGYELALESLDTSDCRLCNVRLDGDIQRVTILVYDNKKHNFINKLRRYSGNDRGRTHEALFANIDEIKLADLRSFWTSSPERYPSSTEEIWWEVWLSRRTYDRREVAEFKAYCEKSNISCGEGHIEFELFSVLSVLASAAQLERCPVLISCLSELRKIVDTSSFLLQQSPYEQSQWADELSKRAVINRSGNTAILILDHGVNHAQPLIAPALLQSDCFSWDQAWPLYDRHNTHGTLQAGLALYGDISQAILSSDSWEITYHLESCRILPPAGSHDRDLYGSLTYFAIHEAEQALGERNRVISMAITADHDGITGQPTSWSSEIDQLAYEGEGKRLFVLSGGNIRGDDVTKEYRQSTASHGIEDPGQCWNGITVGAFTNKIDISDHSFRDWSALAHEGDICPTSRTSHSWGWRHEAPLKPDVVEEGGNLLLSPEEDNLTNADCVSLVTTADHQAGHLFTDHRETSAANALVSRLAAKIWEIYPEYWAETVRALIIHSANWTEVMESYEESALAAGLKPRDAKELMLRLFGHGVPDTQKALTSGNQYLTLVAQDEIKPYKENSGDLSFDQMHLVKLPWPSSELLQLGNAPVRLRVTLSYFIEPNPGRRAYSQRFRYQSFGLRFKLINSDETPDDFIQRVNVAARDEEYSSSQSDGSGWRLGDHLRTRGTVHQDTWEGSASELALRNYVGVIPVAGWWKQRVSRLMNRKSELQVPYSLIISLDAYDADIDLYTPVANQVGITATVPVTT